MIHAGRSPNSAGHARDAEEICNVKYIEDVLKRYPQLRICVPHFGSDEEEEYFGLLPRFPNLYLDSANTHSDYLGKLGVDGQKSYDLFRNGILKNPDQGAMISDCVETLCFSDYNLN